MAIYDSKDRVQKWRYEVKDMRVLVGGLTVTIPTERFNSLEIEHDYLGNLYPIVKIQLVLSSDTYYRIQTNKNSLKFYLRIDKYYYFEDKMAKADLSTKSASKPWINDTFEIILDNNTENMGSAQKREEAIKDYTKLQNDNSDDIDKLDNGVTLYLYKAINELKTNVNKLFTKINVTDAVCWLLTQAGIKNVIMQQPDNVTKYEEFLIPPMSISKALYFIDTYYGLYKLGTLFYSDLDYFYIIPFDASKRKAFLTGESTNTNIVIPTSGAKEHSSEVGVLKKGNSDKDNYIIAEAGSMQISNSSISQDLISGSDATSIDSFEGSNTTANSGATTKTTTATEKVIQNETINSFFTTMNTAISKSLSTEVSFKTGDIDLSMISINKIYNIMFEDPSYTKKYNGKYLITKATHTLNKEGDALTVDSSFVLRKMK